MLDNIVQTCVLFSELLYVCITISLRYSASSLTYLTLSKEKDKHHKVACQSCGGRAL